jgi:hypothetical protein
MVRFSRIIQFCTSAAVRITASENVFEAHFVLMSNPSNVIPNKTVLEAVHSF